MRIIHIMVSYFFLLIVVRKFTGYIRKRVIRSRFKIGKAFSSNGSNCRWLYMSPKMPAKVFLRFFMVSSASSVRVALSEPWRAKPPRPPEEPALGSLLLAVLGAADVDDTVDDWDAGIRHHFLLLFTIVGDYNTY